MVRIATVVRAATTSWIAVLTNAAAAFFLTPAVLHHLGDEAFGLWVLVTTVVGYYGLGDFGMRASVLRYVARQSALGDEPGVNNVITTAFYFYSSLGLAFIIASLLGAQWLPRFFAVSENLATAFRQLFLFAGIVQGMSFPLVVFGASLQAAARFDQIYALRTLSVIVRVIAVVAALHTGGHLFLVGAAALLPNFLFQAAQVVPALRTLPHMSLHPKRIRKSVLRDMFRYGFVSFAVGVGENLRNYIYPVAITKILGPMAVTAFSLPAKLLSPAVEGIGTMTEIVNPLSSRLEARNDFDTLRRLIQLSVQSSVMILIPLAAFLFFFGKETLSLWVGPRYAQVYPLLVLLTLGFGTSATQCSAQSMLFGIERHRKLIWYRLAEGLSVALLGSASLRIWGLVGFATVTSITLMVTSLVLVPRHLCSILGLSLGTYLKEGYLKPCMAGIPMVVALVGLHSVWVVNSWSALIATFIISIFVYAATLAALALRANSSAWLSLGVVDLLVNRFQGFRKLSGQPSLS